MAVLRLVTVTAYCTSCPGRTASTPEVIATWVKLLLSTATAALPRARLRPVTASRRSAVAATRLPLTACGSSCTLSVRLPAPPAGSEPTFHDTMPPATAAPSEAETKLVPGGNGIASTAAGDAVVVELPNTIV